MVLAHCHGTTSAVQLLVGVAAELAVPLAAQSVDSFVTASVAGIVSIDVALAFDPAAVTPHLVTVADQFVEEGSTRTRQTVRTVVSVISVFGVALECLANPAFRLILWLEMVVVVVLFLNFAGQESASVGLAMAVAPVVEFAASIRMIVVESFATSMELETLVSNVLPGAETAAIVAAPFAVAGSAAPAASAIASVLSLPLA